MEEYTMSVFQNPIFTHTGIQYTDNIDVVIDNVPCELGFCITKGYWYFYICDRNFFNTNDGSTSKIMYFNKNQFRDKNTFKKFDENAEISPEIIQSFVNVILNTLDTLEFSKVEGRFILKSVCKKQICQKMVFGKFMENENKER